MFFPAILVHHPAPARTGGSRASQALTLYDGTRNTTPQGQDWLFYTTGGFQTPPHGTGSATFSTLSNAAYQGGYLRIVPFPLDRAGGGYTLHFDLQVLAETHAVPDRAGVDLIALGADKKGIELGFWTDQVWAQSDVPLFKHAEGAPFPTTTALVHYALTFRGQSYVLSANGASILSGRVRDYTAFHGLPDPYQNPNVIFLGDDTKSAAGSFRLARVTVSRSRPLRK